MTRDLRLVFAAAENLPCVFNALVVKNRALREKYPGGVRGFLEKHGGRCNRRITVESFMGGDIDEVIADLAGHGFDYEEDFVFVDAGGLALSWARERKARLRPEPVDLGVDWLEGWIFRGRVFVRHAETPMPTQGAPARGRDE